MIWLTGSNGMLGSMIGSVLTENGIPYLESDASVDIRDMDAVNSFAGGKSINWIINCAAYTAVDAAEDNEQEAFSINRDGAAVLAGFCKKNNSRLIHFSTDYVFNGKPGRPWLEDDPVDPVNLYGKSKLEGEVAIRSMLDEHFIIRISWLFGPRGKNFVSTMIRLFNERDSLNVVNDQTGNPTYTFDVAQLVLAMIKLDSGEFGTYHFACAGQTTWYQLACEIYRQAKNMGIINKNCEINPVSSSQYPTKAKRPEWSVMNRDRVVARMGIELRPWEVAVGDYLKQVQGGNV